MSHEAREEKTGVECFKEEEGVEERRGFCLVEWFMEIGEEEAECGRWWWCYSWRQIGIKVEESVCIDGCGVDGYTLL